VNSNDEQKAYFHTLQISVYVNNERKVSVLFTVKVWYYLKQMKYYW
jgi:hypothetical protein